MSCDAVEQLVSPLPAMSSAGAGAWLGEPRSLPPPGKRMSPALKPCFMSGKGVSGRRVASVHPTAAVTAADANARKTTPFFMLMNASLQLRTFNARGI